MKTAMILAAGRGERLRPLTDVTPKALSKVHGIPLIEHHVINLARAGFNHIIINHAYLGGQIRQHLGNGTRFGIDIVYSPEPPGALETGGGIVNARPLLGDAPFVTVNADIYTDYDFKELALPSNSLAHFILVNKPSYSGQGDFGLSANGLLNNDQKDFTFSGIACYQPAFFEHLKPGRYSVIPMIRQCITASRVTGTLFSGHWADIGTMERLQGLSS